MGFVELSVTCGGVIVAQRKLNMKRVFTMRIKPCQLSPNQLKRILILGL